MYKRQLLEKRGRKYGQHFLIDEGVIDDLVGYVESLSPRLVVEVGSGFGWLTERLAGVADKVLGVEKDPRLYKIAKDRLKKYKNIELILGDILDQELPRDAVVAGAPPYSISTPLLTRIIHYRVRNSILILQRDFVERISRRPGDPHRSYLSTLLEIFGELHILRDVERESFYPPPKVSSQMVRIEIYKGEVEDVEGLTKFLSTIYRHRRKKVKKVFRPLTRGEIGEWTDLKEVVEKRVFELTSGEILKLYLRCRCRGGEKSP